MDGLPSIAYIAPAQEVAIVEEYLRKLERRFLATLTCTPPEPDKDTGKVGSGKWDGKAWSEKQSKNAKSKAEDPDGELTMLGMQRCVIFFINNMPLLIFRLK